MKIQENAKFHFFVQILQNKQYYAQVLLKIFHLNGHTIGFPLQTQKLELTTLHVSIIDSRSERVKLVYLFFICLTLQLDNHSQALR